MGTFPILRKLDRSKRCTTKVHKNATCLVAYDMSKLHNLFYFGTLYDIGKLSVVFCSEQAAYNIFNFSLRYLTNTLSNRVNLFKWKLPQSYDCSFSSVLSLFFMFSLSAGHIFKSASTHGGVSQHYILSPLHYNML